VAPRVNETVPPQEIGGNELVLLWAKLAVALVKVDNPRLSALVLAVLLLACLQ
jgi:hypothetical protein